MTDSPQILVVGGPNGSGKTTVAKQYASAWEIPYVGADEIAATLNPKAPASVRVEAAKRFVQSIENSISHQSSCVVESTLSGRSFQKYLSKASACGFEITTVFVFVDSADLCVARVAERVGKGGHDVPEQDIRRRYLRSLRNFWTIYCELSDKWVVLYNGGQRIQDVVIGSRDKVTVRDDKLHTTFMTLIETIDE